MGTGMSVSEVETDPCLHDTWLTRLSVEEQDTLRTRWNQRAEEESKLARRECHRALVDHAAIIAVYGIGDLLHGWGGMSFFTALCLGAFVGGLVLVLDAPRVFAFVLGGCGLFLHQWIVRDGLSAGEAALLLPLLAIFWIVGRRREVA